MSSIYSRYRAIAHYQTIHRLPIINHIPITRSHGRSAPVERPRARANLQASNRSCEIAR